jgi:hypothetical protein
MEAADGFDSMILPALLETITPSTAALKISLKGSSMSLFMFKWPLYGLKMGFDKIHRI